MNQHIQAIDPKLEDDSSVLFDRVDLQIMILHI